LTGTTGATGATGAQGPIGLTGPQGPAGTSSSWTDVSSMVTTTKNVGIGVANPLYNADVSSGGAAKSSLHFSQSGADVGGWLTSVMDNNFFVSSGAVYDATAGGWIQKSSDGKSVTAGSGGVGFTVTTQSGGVVGSVISTLPRLRIDYNGNVGIGTTAPTQKLEVNGAVRLNTASAKPVTCDSTVRGTFWFDQTGPDDVVYVCARIGGLYSWKTVTLQ
jgi:hypothetical protein